MSIEREEVIEISIPKKMYQKLRDLCNINNWDTNKKIFNILEDAISSAEILDGEFKQVINF